MTTNYRRPWSDMGARSASRDSYLNSPLRGVILTREGGPTILEKMNDAAYALKRSFSDLDKRAEALKQMAGAVQEAHDAGYMIEVTHNRDRVRSNSWKHCITLTVIRPNLRPYPVFVNQMGREQFDAILPAIRQMFVGGEVQA